MKLNSLNKLVVGGFLTAWLAAQPALAQPVEIDSIVAVVNNGVITRHELDQQFAKIMEQLRRSQRSDAPLPPRQVLQRQVLDRMITERVLLQAAEATNIKIDNPTLNRALTRIAEQNNLDLPAFKAAIEREGQSFEALREQVRTEMVITRLREREVDSKILVTETEVDNFLANPSLDLAKQTEYNLAHILILAPEGASPETLQELQAKAERARQELLDGADFSRVSTVYSDSQNALQGGGLGWRAEAKLPALFAQAVRGLAPGEVSAVLRSANGFHILKLLDKRGAEAETVVQQTRARHILVKTNDIISDQDAADRLADLRERIVNGTDFGRLAKIHSDDLSASKEGDLGWLNPGETVPEFEQAMNALQAGEISAPVRSAFGWHLIQVLERRVKDMTEERKRMDARRAILERKSDDAFDDWVRQTRDRAYVEYRLAEQ